MTSLRGLRLQLLLAMLTAGLLAGCGGSKSRFESHLRKGEEFLTSDNLDKAGVEFRNAAQIQPKSAVALYYLGRVAEARGNVREAYGYYAAAVEADPKYEAAQAGAGKMLIFGGAGKRALDMVSAGLGVHPDNADLLAVRAAAHQELKESDAARADAERAVKVAPANENAVAILAALYIQQKDYPRATALVESTLARVPKSVDLREVLTNLYLMNHQPAQAEAQMRAIIQLKPLNLGPRNQLALFLFKSGNVDGAQAALEAAVQEFSGAQQAAKADQAKLLLTDFISLHRSREQGEKRLREFITREPDNLDLRLGLGALLQRTGAQTEALTAYREIVKRDGTGPKGLMARDRMAAIELGLGNATQARAAIDAVLLKSPRDDDALILRATLAMQQNDPTSAIADLRAVLRDQPNSIQLQRSLAAAYIAKEQPALAEDTLRAALKIAPTDVPAQLDLAQLLARTDRAAQAVTLLEAASHTAQNPQPVYEALLRTYMAAGNLPKAHDTAEQWKQKLPNAAGGYLYAGLIDEQRKALDDSRGELEAALKAEPRNFSALVAFARVEMERGAYDSAIARVAGALQQTPDNVDIVNLLGGLYLQHRDYKRAEEMFTQASTLNPKLWQPHRNLALVRMASKDDAGAIAELRKALVLAPADMQLTMELARVYEREGHIEEAIASYESLYKNNQRGQQLAANNLAMLLVTYKTAQPSLNRARDLTNTFAASTNGSLLDTAGWVRFKRGEYREALQTLERAAERAPDSKVIRFHLGMAELQLGMRDRARTSLEAALSGAGDFQGVDEARSALATLKVRA
jgi:Flp pilus assembly protein TadD